MNEYTEEGPEGLELTFEGVVKASEIFEQFKGGEPLEKIADNVGMESVAEVTAFMQFAESTGVVDVLSTFTHPVWKMTVVEAQAFFDLAADQQEDALLHATYHAAGSVIELSAKTGYRPDDYMRLWIEALYDDTMSTGGESGE